MSMSVFRVYVYVSLWDGSSSWNTSNIIDCWFYILLNLVHLPWPWEYSRIPLIPLMLSLYGGFLIHGATPKSSVLIGFSIRNQSILIHFGIPHLWNPPYVPNHSGECRFLRGEDRTLQNILEGDASVARSLSKVAMGNPRINWRSSGSYWCTDSFIFLTIFYGDIQIFPET